ncbi:unnamed protein product [Paramecium primaurelia]|uniref:Uncharacterized protein n=1 Tax=Paramecium primaurelia TaxID=5886 RepID=A0A8S1PL23_PARPR|nr:unnamed protein product [Paramecium primaurelia]
MNKIIDKKQSVILDPVMVMKNWEYLKDHLVMEDLVKQSKNEEGEEDLDTTIIICNSDYDD